MTTIDLPPPPAVLERSPSSAPLRVRITTRRGTCSVQLVGELDISNDHQVRDLAGLVRVTGATAMQLDVRALAFVDVAGWRALRSLAAVLEARGIRCSQSGRSPALDRVDRVLQAVQHNRAADGQHHVRAGSAPDRTVSA